MSQEEAPNSVDKIDNSPLTIGQRNYLKRTFNAHKDEVEHLVAKHRREVGKIFEDYSKQIAESVKNQNSDMVKSMNESLAKVDKKFSGMYSVLINKFLVKQEQKVFVAECGLQAMLEVTAKRLFSLNQALSPPVMGEEEERRKKFLEDFQGEIEELIPQISEEIVRKAEEKAKQAQEEANAKKDQAVADQAKAGEAPAPSSN